MKKLDINNIYNCILGGAIGDSLGFSVRNMGYDEIVEKYGKRGITTLEVDCDNKARVTDNTQLSIFTIDALIRAYNKYYVYGITGFGRVITYTSYLRWQYAQGRKIPLSRDTDQLQDNYLMDIQELKYERCAEEYTKQVLENESYDEDIEDLNNNKGYLCLTKTAPVGIMFYQEDKIAFEMAVKIAKLTHGNPLAYLSCGVFSVIIANIVKGNKLEKSIETALRVLKSQKEDKEIIKQIIDKIKMGLELSKDNVHYPEKLDDFGLCDDAHETLAAAIYISLTFQDNISSALLYCANNNCYGNNIGAVVGNILGLYSGLDVIATEWSKKLEMHDLYKSLAFDLCSATKGELPKEVDNYDKELSFDNIKYNNELNIANWWLLRYDKE